MQQDGNHMDTNPGLTSGQSCKPPGPTPQGEGLSQSSAPLPPRGSQESTMPRDGGKGSTNSGLSSSRSQTGQEMVEPPATHPHPTPSPD